jgi:hypothetical protein
MTGHDSEGDGGSGNSRARQARTRYVMSDNFWAGKGKAGHFRTFQGKSEPSREGNVTAGQDRARQAKS